MTNQNKLTKTVKDFFGASVSFSISEDGNRQIEVINPNNGGAWITVEKANWDYERLSAFMLREVWKQIHRQLQQPARSR